MVITAAATAVPDGSAPASVVDLAGRVARSCLARARVSASSIGVLVNVGVYREHNTFEPAMAALVQKEVGINLDYIADPDPAAGFSFDLMNGACGVLNAVQVGHALLETGSTERVLITAADVHPGVTRTATPATRTRTWPAPSCWSAAPTPVPDSVRCATTPLTCPRMSRATSTPTPWAGTGGPRSPSGVSRATGSG